MIVTKTPVRISFLGGGTDYPDYFRQHGGQTLGVAINKYSYVTVNRLVNLFEYNARIGYSRAELVNSVDEIEHPAVRECLRYLNIDGGLEINYMGDLPARTGLGSSSSFTVGMLHALHLFKGELVNQEQLGAEAVYVEQEMINERVGVQDQYICAHGGLVQVFCHRDGNVNVKPLPLSIKRLSEFKSNLMLFYTGIRRHAHKILEEQIERTRENILTNELSELYDLVDQGIDILSGSQHLSQFGELLHSGWVIKQRLSSRISNPKIDEWYQQARQAGAIGGKLLGAGGGGFLLLFVDPKHQQKVEMALPELRKIKFDFDHEGSKLLFYSPNGED